MKDYTQLPAGLPGARLFFAVEITFSFLWVCLPSITALMMTDLAGVRPAPWSEAVFYAVRTKAVSLASYSR